MIKIEDNGEGGREVEMSGNAIELTAEITCAAAHLYEILRKEDKEEAKNQMTMLHKTIDFGIGLVDEEDENEKRTESGGKDDGEGPIQTS